MTDALNEAQKESDFSTPVPAKRLGTSEDIAAAAVLSRPPNEAGLRHRHHDSREWAAWQCSRKLARLILR
jgi:hypothetical protein